MSTVTVASTGTGTHEVLQVVLPADNTAAVGYVMLDYVGRHGDEAYAYTIPLTTMVLPDGRVEHTIMVYAPDDGDPS